MEGKYPIRDTLNWLTWSKISRKKRWLHRNSIAVILFFIKWPVTIFSERTIILLDKTLKTTLKTIIDISDCKFANVFCGCSRCSPGIKYYMHISSLCDLIACLFILSNSNRWALSKVQMALRQPTKFLSLFLVPWEHIQPRINSYHILLL